MPANRNDLVARRISGPGTTGGNAGKGGNALFGFGGNAGTPGSYACGVYIGRADHGG